MMNFESPLLTVMKSIICSSCSTARGIDALFVVWTWEAGASWLSSLAASFLKFSEKKNLYFLFHLCCFVLICKSCHCCCKTGQKSDFKKKNTLIFGIVICKGICLHWRKHKAVQYFHTIAFSFCSGLLLFCFRSTCLREEKKDM